MNLHYHEGFLLNPSHIYLFNQLNFTMKNLAFLLVFALLPLFGAQAQTFPPLDKSPLDVSYFPLKDKPVLARITYSRPGKNGREIFGKLVPYEKVWRVGANEATEIKLYKDATIGGKKVKAGSYSLFAIPGEKEWTIILSTDTDVWGAYTYNKGNDVVRFTSPVTKSDQAIENFSITFTKGEKQATSLLFGWDNVIVTTPVSF